MWNGRGPRVGPKTPEDAKVSSGPFGALFILPEPCTQPRASCSVGIHLVPLELAPKKSIIVHLLRSSVVAIAMGGGVGAPAALIMSTPKAPTLVTGQSAFVAALAMPAWVDPLPPSAR